MFVFPILRAKSPVRGRFMPSLLLRDFRCGTEVPKIVELQDEE